MCPFGTPTQGILVREGYGCQESQIIPAGGNGPGLAQSRVPGGDRLVACGSYTDSYPYSGPTLPDG